MIDRYMLRYFLAVAENGNFSRAAKRVSVTQPTLSAGIAKLERQVGARLFDRDTKRVALTPAGSRFLLRARRIAAIPTAIVEDLVARHRRSGGSEALELLDGSERDLAERLDRGRLDIALTVVRPQHARFRPETLRSERYLMVLPADHPLANLETVEAEQLARDRMVVRRHCEALPEISRFFAERGVRPSFVLKTTDDARVLAVVRAGAGIGMMPECFRDSPEGRQARFLRVADFDLQREIGLLYAASSNALRYEASPFIALVRERYGRSLSARGTLAPP
jgi:DNA-binding transcriptional LysR family regulator